MSDDTIRISKFTEGEVMGSVAFPYRGYEISLCTTGHPQTCIYPNKDSGRCLTFINGADINSLKEAMVYIDQLIMVKEKVEF